MYLPQVVSEDIFPFDMFFGIFIFFLEEVFVISKNFLHHEFKMVAVERDLGYRIQIFSLCWFLGF